MRRKKRTRNNNVTYRQGFFNPELDANIFNHMMGSDDGESVECGLAEGYDDQAVKIRYSSIVDPDDVGYISMTDLCRLLDGDTDRIWVNNYPEDVGGKYGDGTIRRDVIKRVYGDSEEAHRANEYIRKMSKQPRIPDRMWRINESTFPKSKDRLSRIRQRTKDNDAFIVIGSQDRDAEEDRDDELIDKVNRLPHFNRRMRRK